MKLLRIQKNELFERIEASGLSPSLFVFQDSNPILDNSTYVRYKGTPYYFQIFENDSRQYPIGIRFSPGQNTFIEDRNSENWPWAADIFMYWLNNLLTKITLPDKWERFNDEIKNLKFSFSNENDKFSISEYEELKTQITLLKHNFRMIQLVPEQLAILENKIDHLTELAKDLGKFDWKSLFVGTIVSIIIQLGVTPENALAIWDLVKKAFNRNFLLP